MRIRAFSTVVLFLFCFQLANAATPLPLKVAGDVVLDARYYAADKPGPGLLFLNMCDPSDDQTAWANVATALNEHGFHVLTFDYRGFAKSGGEMPTGLSSVAEAMPYWRENWVPDVKAAYELLQAQDGVTVTEMGKNSDRPEPTPMNAPALPAPAVFSPINMPRSVSLIAYDTASAPEAVR
jgi:hypothetical protein